MIQMEITKKIETYLDGTMGKEERIEFEILAKNDKELSNLIIMHREIDESIRDQDLFVLKNKLHEILFLKPHLFYNHFLRIAAIIIFLAVVGFIIKMYFLPGISGINLYEKYYKKYNSDVIKRSAINSSSSFENALIQYEIGNYSRSIQFLDSLIQNDNFNFMALFYKGLNSLELDETNNAIESFSKIPEEWNNTFKIHRDWYLALALLKANMVPEAKIILKKLSESKNIYSLKSQAIIHKLKI
jgi:hypothetical protein